MVTQITFLLLLFQTTKLEIKKQPEDFTRGELELSQGEVANLLEKKRKQLL